jgi:hypothetical protein
MKALVDALLYRSSSTGAANLLINANFINNMVGGVADTWYTLNGASAPWGWMGYNAAAKWALHEDTSAPGHWYMVIGDGGSNPGLDVAGGFVGQYVFMDTGGMLGTRFRVNDILSAAVALRGNQRDVRFTVTLYSNVPTSNRVIGQMWVDIPSAGVDYGYVRTYTMTGRVTQDGGNQQIHYMLITLTNLDGASPCAIELRGMWLGRGFPPTDIDGRNADFMPRGNINVPALDHSNMGGKRITNLADGTPGSQDAATVNQLGTLGGDVYNKTTSNSHFLARESFPGGSSEMAIPLTMGDAQKIQGRVGVTAHDIAKMNGTYVDLGAADLGARLLAAAVNQVKAKVGVTDYQIWHEGRQGHGTLMDADKLDGYERTDVNPTVGFCAQNTVRQVQSPSPAGSYVVNFPTVLQDVGTPPNYDPVNSRFVAPFNGVYFFSCSFPYGDRNGTTAQIAFWKNGVPFGPLGATLDLYPAFNGSSVVMYLTTGQTVDVRITVTGGNFWVELASTFSGFCIRKD